MQLRTGRNVIIMHGLSQKPSKIQTSNLSMYQTIPTPSSLSESWTLLYIKNIIALLKKKRFVFQPIFESNSPHDPNLQLYW